jgi:hypothetical protein
MRWIHQADELTDKPTKKSLNNGPAPEGKHLHLPMLEFIESSLEKGAPVTIDELESFVLKNDANFLLTPKRRNAVPNKDTQPLRVR